jgi:ribosomal protein L7/L12
MEQLMLLEKLLDSARSVSNEKINNVIKNEQIKLLKILLRKKKESVKSPHSCHSELDWSEENALRNGGTNTVGKSYAGGVSAKLPVIKMVRDRTGYSLAEAKELVEREMVRLDIK